MGRNLIVFRSDSFIEGFKDAYCISEVRVCTEVRGVFKVMQGQGLRLLAGKQGRQLMRGLKFFER